MGRKVNPNLKEDDRDVMWREHHLVFGHVYETWEEKQDSKTISDTDSGCARLTWQTDPASRPGQDGTPPRLSKHAWTWCDPGGTTVARRTGGSVGCPPRSVGNTNKTTTKLPNPQGFTRVLLLHPSPVCLWGWECPCQCSHTWIECLPVQSPTNH